MNAAATRMLPSVDPQPGAVPEEGLLSGELLDTIVAAIERLPPSQRAVIALRDIDAGRPARSARRSR